MNKLEAYNMIKEDVLNQAERFLAMPDMIMAQFIMSHASEDKLDEKVPMEVVSGIYARLVLVPRFVAGHAHIFGQDLKMAKMILEVHEVIEPMVNLALAVDERPTLRQMRSKIQTIFELTQKMINGLRVPFEKIAGDDDPTDFDPLTDFLGEYN